MSGEALLANLVLLLAILGVVTAGAWTYLDSRDRGAGYIAPLWGLGVTGFIFLGIFYLYFRRFIGKRATPPDARERTLAVLSIGSLFAVAVSLFIPFPDSVTLGWYLLGLWPIGILIGYAIIYRNQYLGDG